MRNSRLHEHCKGDYVVGESAIDQHKSLHVNWNNAMGEKHKVVSKMAEALLNNVR